MRVWICRTRGGDEGCCREIYREIDDDNSTIVVVLPKPSAAVLHHSLPSPPRCPHHDANRKTATESPGAIGTAMKAAGRRRDNRSEHGAGGRRRDLTTAKFREEWENGGDAAANNSVARLGA